MPIVNLLAVTHAVRVLVDVVDLVGVDICLPPAGSLLKLHVNILAGVDHQH